MSFLEVNKIPQSHIAPRPGPTALAGRNAETARSALSSAASAKAAATAPSHPPQTTQKTQGAAAGVEVSRSLKIEANAPAFDTDRVAEIRTALKQGTYPIIPAKISDAMIAAKYILSST